MTPLELFTLLAIVAMVVFAVTVAICVAVLVAASCFGESIEARLDAPDPDHPPP